MEPIEELLEEDIPPPVVTLMMGEIERLKQEVASLVRLTHKLEKDHNCTKSNLKKVLKCMRMSGAEPAASMDFDDATTLLAI